MHAIRGSWVGQTFALARCHDSGEKKARIRRSKEERKELVVSFIKKYQLSNKGDFPSLSITQREVGGSFYTIREIVREIIQENRVLGPAKSTIDEQEADKFFDQYPLGSVAMEPDIHAVSSNGPHIVNTSNLSNTLQNTMESQVLDISEKCQEFENQKLEDGIIVHGSSYQSEQTQGFGGELENEPPVVRALVGEDILEREVVISEAKITQVAADVVIETFPIKPVTDALSLDGDSGEPRVVSETLEENESGHVNLETVKNGVILNTDDVQEKSSRFVVEKTNGIIVNGSSYQSEQTQGFGGELENEPPVVRGLVGEDILEREVVISEARITQVAADIVIETFPIKPVTDALSLVGDSGEPRVVSETLEENESENVNLETVKNDVILNTDDVQEKSSRFVDEKTNSHAEDEEADSLPESLNHSVREIGNVLRVDGDSTDLENNDIFPAEINHMSVPNSTRNLGAASCGGIHSGGIQGQSISEKVIAIGKKSGIKNGNNSKKSSDPTLDRINLESWEATTERSSGPQTNFLLDFVKACITAFVKFWSE